MTWDDWEKLWRNLLIVYAGEWKCPLPERSQADSAEVESECDVWCSKLAGQLGDPLPAPLRVRPWILARLAMCGGHAKLCEAAGELPPQKLTRKLAEEFLTTLWHQKLKALWLSGEISFPA